MSVALPSTKGGGLLCVTNERWGQHDAPPQLHEAFHCTNAWGAPKGANRHAFIVHECKGFANEVSVGLVTPFTPYHRLGNTLWREFELDIGSFGRFGPF
jgi:hypothetical protein